MILSTFIEELYTASCLDGMLKRTEYQRLQWIHQAGELSDRERRLVERLFYAVRRGWLRLS